jgi:hypothetical protein
MAGIAGTSSDSEAVQPLRDQVRAQVITAVDEGYDDARAVHNGMFDRHPLAVVKAEQVADVMAAVNFAREHALDLSVRAAGTAGRRRPRAAARRMCGGSVEAFDGRVELAQRIAVRRERRAACQAWWATSTAINIQKSGNGAGATRQPT